MQIRNLLSIYPVVALIYALGLLVAPGFWSYLYDAAADPQATLLLRLIGAIYGGLAVMTWVARGAEPSRSREGMVLGLTVLNALAALVAVMGALSGVYNAFAWGPVVTFGL